MSNLPKKVVMATGNPGKIREIARLLDGLGVEIVAQSEFGVVDADETGTTFAENSLIKARHAAAASGLPAIAAHLDDMRRAALFAEILALGAQAWMTGTDRALFTDLDQNLLADPAEDFAARCPHRVDIEILSAGGHYYLGGEELVTGTHRSLRIQEHALEQRRPVADPRGAAGPERRRLHAHPRLQHAHRPHRAGVRRGRPLDSESARPDDRIRVGAPPGDHSQVVDFGRMHTSRQGVGVQNLSRRSD